MILHLVDTKTGPLVYVDAKDDYLTPDEARRLAIKLLELAQQAERPTVASEWP
ncbi:hypothetical protein K2F54_05340 [Cryobacterium sp. 1639]|uniref:hypothetical protein n=1 Tax=Cryobacterium inferilacus TaxID=2866629 RepID=UPI001C737A1D|nr:hypothetical protein [Cryobacterium sp. 1639]MBX0299400.1 hypothetical protein [Cryobacterium sp. 1639]